MRGLRWMVPALGVACCIVSSSGAMAAGPVAVDILPHRALYAVSMEQSSSASEVIGVQGKMAFEWRDDCDGWAVEQRYLMDFSRADGDGFAMRSQFTTWESKDGAVYRFLVDRSRNGGKQRLEGRATLEPPTGGTAAFVKPEKQHISLSKEAIFPTEHTLRLIRAALTGERFFRANVFDGSEVEGDALISAVIGKAREGAPPLDHAAVTGPFWPIRLAFFKPGASGQAPDFEMSIELMANGVARNLVLDYGDFSARLTLEQIEVVDSPACARKN
ncbi:MAG: cell envelope integrity EipB family protein [Alphaproteobacteria bacterium]|nr:cell envelope integrity EipB family protein [Alphaproteobacteria bacterium]